MSSELKECQYLLSLTTNPNIRHILQQHEQTLLQSSSLSSIPSSIPPSIPSSSSQPLPSSTSSTSSPPSSSLLQNHMNTSMDIDPLSSSIPTTLSSKPYSYETASSSLKYIPITDFAWDQGGYNSPMVTVYIELNGVGNVKDHVECHFTQSSFDVTVHGLNGKDYRLIKDNLEKDIVPEQSKFIVKKNKIVVKLQKVKGEYSYDHWAHLTAKKPKSERADSKKDPSASIMDMMKDMYDEGDDNMKKIIGEAMMKSRSGEKMSPMDTDL